MWGPWLGRCGGCLLLPPPPPPPRTIASELLLRCEYGGRGGIPLACCCGREEEEEEEEEEKADGLKVLSVTERLRCMWRLGGGSGGGVSSSEGVGLVAELLLLEMCQLRWWFRRLCDSGEPGVQMEFDVRGCRMDQTWSTTSRCVRMMSK